MSTPEAQAGPILRIAQISKSYPGVRAVRDVTLDVRRGETLGIVGANGAGKSTLMRMISGGESPDSGHLEVDGERVSLRSAADGISNGVVLVSQHLSVVPNLTVRENLMLGLDKRRRLPGEGRRLGDVEGEIEGVLRRLGLQVDLDVKARELSPAVLKLLMIGAGLLRRPRLLILDEPTAILAGAEVERLFEILRSLRAEQQTIVYISHRLPEVLALADRIAVMRGGQLVATEEASQTTTGRLAGLMVGGVVEQPRRREGALAVDTSAAPRLECRDLTRSPKIAGINLQVRPGEILGLAGLVGSGRTSLIRTICGVEKADSGAVLIDGEDVTPRSPKKAIAAGIAHVPEDRARLAVIPRMSVASNVTLPDKRPARPFPALPFIGPRTERAAVAPTLAELQIEPKHAARLAIGGLSGGNQQKAVLARWLMHDARVFLFDEPTEGIDVVARAQVHELIRGLAARGVAVILSSSDVEEVALMSDRVLVMRGGVVTHELGSDQISETAIGHASLGEEAPGRLAPAGV
ncbi:sugar ABC transporter ATP-binding protein [Conexibacter sp. CPCC 206217]|uniref:sugar ABC transporter ATP-binding protein n=1 Tax=Conexibacter sp. CPCC 206217 TaxID=3064574 RepID=UPI0027241108|nr:sugar ABC transporter ATP-binding protein [Conexibacter sp. CPCC 206217]MDO8212431.1 sugar ABC transporter ATP-binding protein [Conexibacter sp. CPCC 206217]